MKAMILEQVGQPLKLVERADPVPEAGQLLIKVEACAVCRTDLHVVDGDLPHPKLPLIPGHEIVGRVVRVGEGADPARLGRRVGVPWLSHTCSQCIYCSAGAENLCDAPRFTGYTCDGGFATHVVADEDFVFDLPNGHSPVSLAPLLCAGLIGWRCLKRAGSGKRLGIYGFGAAAHIVCQIAVWQEREIYAFTSPGDRQSQDFARSLGACWAGASNEQPPAPLDAAIIFAPVGPLVPLALRSVRKGGRVICGGIHMSDLPQMPYALLWGERKLESVANLTRDDGIEFFPLAQKAGVHTSTTTYALADANTALEDLRRGRLTGAAVLVP